MEHVSVRKNKGARGMGVKVACVALALLGPIQSHAAIDCIGKVVKVLLYADGTLNLLGSWRGDYTVLCSTTYGSVSAEVCMGWYGLLVKAKAENTDVTVYYNTTYACNNLPTYGSSPTPVYVGAW